MPCLKSVQGSFHQGNIKIGETAGKQCTCCSLFSVAFTLVKTPGYWDRKDLDFILENGNRIYKGLNTNRYLMVPELPRQILLFESQIVQVEFKTNKFGFLNSQSVPGSLLNRNVSSDANGLLLLLKGLCVSIVSIFVVRVEEQARRGNYSAQHSTLLCFAFFKRIHNLPISKIYVRA